MRSVKARVLAALGQRQADRGGTAQRRGDAGHDIDRDACSLERRLLLAAAAEDIGIAALEAHDMPAGLGFSDQDRVDFALLGRGLVGRLADRDADRIAAGISRIAGPDQAVMDDDVGLLQLALRLERQKLRIAGARAHERDAAGPDWGCRQAQPQARGHRPA